MAAGMALFLGPALFVAGGVGSYYTLPGSSTNPSTGTAPRYAVIDFGTNMLYPMKVTSGTGTAAGGGPNPVFVLIRNQPPYTFGGTNYVWSNGTNAVLAPANSSDVYYEATDIDRNGRVVGLESIPAVPSSLISEVQLDVWAPGVTTASLTTAPLFSATDANSYVVYETGYEGYGEETSGSGGFLSAGNNCSRVPLVSPGSIWSIQCVGIIPDHMLTPSEGGVWDGFQDSTRLGSLAFPYTLSTSGWSGSYTGINVTVLAVNDSNQAVLEKDSNFLSEYTYSAPCTYWYSTTTTYTLGGSTVPFSLALMGGQGILSNTNALGTTYLLGSDITLSSWNLSLATVSSGPPPVYSTINHYYCWDGTTTYTLPQPSGTLVAPTCVNAATTTLVSGSSTNTVAATQIIGNDSSGNPYLWEMAATTNTVKSFNAPVNLNNLLATNSGWNVNQANSINDSGIVAAQVFKTSDSTYHGALLVPCEISVDANRDGKVVLANDANNPANVDSHGNPLPVDTTSSAKPYRFWVNNNEDQSSYDIRFGTSPKTVPPDSSHLDYLSSTIVSKLDLEDWTRLWIYTKGLNTAIQSGAIKVGLKWQPLSGTTPGIKIVKATDSDGGIEYLSDTTGAAATAQATTGGSPRPVLQDANDSHTNIVPTGGAADFVFPTSVWSSLSDTAPKTYFLFEGTSRGQGQLQIVFLKSDGTTLLGSGGNLWLDIRDIKEMYQRAIAAGAGPAPTPPTEPYVYGSPGFSDSIGTSIDASNPFVAPSDETHQCIVFVHGWYTDWNGFTEYSEDFYKRLWWQGYKGRLIGFTWPALSGAATYNSSEWNAWLYGKCFKNYINSVKGSYTNFTVAGHSMGNVVVGSAIQQGLTIPNYILLQAAEPTGLYTTNNTYNNYAPFINQEATYPTPDTAANLGYRGFITPAFGNVGTYYCFYNPSDYALATGTTFGFASNWEANQLGYKPDGDPGSAGLGHYTSYGTTLVSGASGTWDPDNIFHPVLQVTESHESMSFIARSRSKAAGADVHSANVFTSSTDLSQPPYNFGTAETDHSGQFLRDYNLVYPLYHQFETIIAPTP